MFDVKAMTRKLEEVGVQPTAQRITICHYVLCEADHPTAEDVKEWVDRRFPKISMATVYNTLKTLVEANLIRELRLPHSTKLLYDRNMSDHHHFVDEESGQVTDIDAAQIEVKPKLSKGFIVNEVQLVLSGRRLREVG